MKTLIIIMVVIFAMSAVASGAVVLVSSFNENDKERYATKIGDTVKKIWHNLDEAILTATMIIVIIGAAMFIIGGGSMIAEIGLGMSLFGPFIPVLLIPAYEFIDEHFIKK